MVFVLILCWLVLLSAVSVIVFLEISRKNLVGRLVRPFLSTSLLYWGTVYVFSATAASLLWLDVAAVTGAFMALVTELMLRVKKDF